MLKGRVRFLEHFYTILGYWTLFINIKIFDDEALILCDMFIPNLGIILK